jgi:hypothetical protein
VFRADLEALILEVVLDIRDLLAQSHQQWTGGAR